MRKTTLIKAMAVSMVSCMAISVASLGAFSANAESLGTEELVTVTGATVTTAVTSGDATGLQVAGEGAHSYAINGIFDGDLSLDLAITAGLESGKNQFMPVGSYFKVEDVTDPTNFFTIEYYGTGWGNWYAGVRVKYSKDGTDYTRSIRYDTGEILASAEATDQAQVYVLGSTLDLKWDNDVLSVIVPQWDGGEGAVSVPTTICKFDGTAEINQDTDAYAVPKISFSNGYKISYSLAGAATVLIKEANGTSFAGTTVESVPTWYTNYVNYLDSVPKTPAENLVTATGATVTPAVTSGTATGLKVAGKGEHSFEINGIFDGNMSLDLAIAEGLANQQAMPVGSYFKVEDVTDPTNFFVVEYFGTGWDNWYTGVRVKYSKDGTEYTRSIRYDTGEILTSVESSDSATVIAWDSSLSLKWAGDVLSVIVPQNQGTYNTICKFDGAAAIDSATGAYAVPKISFPNGYKVSYHLAGSATTFIESINGVSLVGEQANVADWYSAYEQ